VAKRKRNRSVELWSLHHMTLVLEKAYPEVETTEVKITPEMIEPGAAELGLYVFDFIIEGRVPAIVRDVFLAMHAASLKPSKTGKGRRSRSSPRWTERGYREPNR
jgi:hypothetical protein